MRLNRGERRLIAQQPDKTLPGERAERREGGHACTRSSRAFVKLSSAPPAPTVVKTAGNERASEERGIICISHRREAAPLVTEREKKAEGELGRGLITA